VVPLRGRFWAPFSSAKQNKRFLLLFLEKEDIQLDWYINSFLRDKPSNHLGGFVEILGRLVFCEAELRFLLLFLEKEDIHLD
jgi:hypothetical protein